MDIKLPAKLLDYFLRSNESNINQTCRSLAHSDQGFLKFPRFDGARLIHIKLFKRFSTLVHLFLYIWYMSESSNQPPLSRSIKTLFADNPSPQGQQTRHNGLTYLRQSAARVHHWLNARGFAFFNGISKIYPIAFSWIKCGRQMKFKLSQVSSVAGQICTTKKSRRKETRKKERKETHFLRPCRS